MTAKDAPSSNTLDAASPSVAVHPARSSSRRANAVLFVLTVLVLLIGTELVLRVVYQPENLGTVIQFDPLLGWSLKPGSMLISNDRQRDLHYRIDVNSIGLRDREIPIPKPPGRKRVLIIGDSIAFGSGVEARERFSNLLNGTLPGDAEVINAGVPGWGNDQELLFYERDLRRLQPDVVVLQFTGGNDVVNNELNGPLIEEGAKPRFRCVADSLVLEPVKSPAPARQPLSVRIRHLLRKSRLLVFVKRRLEMRSYRQRARVNPAIAHAGFEADRQLSHWSVYDVRGGPAIESAWQVTERIISRLARDCRADSAALVVFAMPLKIEVDVPWRDNLMQAMGTDSTNYDFTLPYRRLGAYCARDSIEFVYPIAAFREAARGAPLYFEHDGHPNAGANAVAAEYLKGVLTPLLNR